MRVRAPLRALPLLATVTTILAAVLGSPVPASAASSSDLPVHIQLSSLEPRAPRPGQQISVQGRVRNVGHSTLTQVRVELRASASPVTSRAELADLAATPSAQFGAAVQGRHASVQLPPLAPGASAGYLLSVPVDRLQLPGMGVYPFGVAVVAAHEGTVGTVGRLRTFLPYTTPNDHAKPTKLAWIWPLAALPDRNPDGTFPNAHLAGELAPGGRLSALVSAAQRYRTPPVRSGARAAGVSRAVPVTLAVDPALLEDLTIMSHGYSVSPPGSTARTPGPGQAAAAAFLAAARTLAGSDPVFALPYANPDIVALVRAGRAHDVEIARGTTFRQLTQGALGTIPLHGVAWPPGGFITQSALDTALPDVSTLILSGAALPVSLAATYTPGAGATVPAVGGGTIRALASDPTLDEIVRSGAAGGPSLRLDEQRFLAETLLITAERPSISRTILITPPPRWRPDPAWTNALLRDTSRVPWLRAVTIDQIGVHPSQAALRGPLTYPSSAQAAELPASDFTGPGSTGQLWSRLNVFRQILTAPDAAGVPGLERGILRAESADWRGHPRQAAALRREDLSTLRYVTDKVRISSQSGEVSLASQSSTIPVSVANGLDQPVRVQLVLRGNEARLSARDTGIQRIAAGRQIQLEIHVQAASSGVFPVYAQLLTPSGVPYGGRLKILVHSTRYGVLTLAITGVAMLVLLVGAAVRVGRRLRESRRGGVASGG